MNWTQIFRENLNCYALSIFRVFILLASSDSDKHMLMRQKSAKQRFAYIKLSKQMITSISSDAFQCAYCKADLGWKAYCIGRVEYKVCTKPKPACFVTQQFKEGEFKISRGCGSEMEYQKAKNTCRESPKTCPLINRCNGSKCVATYPSEYIYI